MQSNKHEMIEVFAFVMIFIIGKLDLSQSLNYYNNQQMDEQMSTLSRRNKGNSKTRRNHLIFAISMLCIQLTIFVLYAIFVTPTKSSINIQSVTLAILLAFLVVAGFGMYFSYLKNLIWNGIGFAFFITAFSIELYPLINALWSKVGIHSNKMYADSFSTRNYYLSVSTVSSQQYQNNTITSAIKCALSIVIGFGSVIGRVGPLECLIMSVVGIIGYELNRSIIIDNGQDSFGTFSIFTFGGFLGLVFGVIMILRERKSYVYTLNHNQLSGNQQTIVNPLIGSMFIFLLFPLLAFESDNSQQSPLFSKYNAPVAIILSMGSAVVSCVSVSLFVQGNEGLRVKDLVNSVIAGGIITGAASYYITSPLLAVISGAVGGSFQYVFDNLQKRIYNRWGVVSTYSFTLFCFQSFLGAIFAAGYNNRITISGTTDGFIFPSTLSNPGNQMVIFLISAGLGTVCGALVGGSCYYLNKYRIYEMFHDKTQFVADDGMSFLITKRIEPRPEIQTNQPKEKTFEKTPNQHNHNKYNLSNRKQVSQRRPDAIVEPQLEEEELPKSRPEPNYVIDQDHGSSQQVSDNSFEFADMLQVEIQ